MEQGKPVSQNTLIQGTPDGGGRGKTSSVERRQCGGHRTTGGTQVALTREF